MTKVCTSPLLMYFKFRCLILVYDVSVRYTDCSLNKDRSLEKMAIVTPYWNSQANKIKNS